MLPRVPAIKLHTDRLPVFNPLALVILPVPKPFCCHYKVRRLSNRGWCGQAANWIHVGEHGVEVDVLSWKTMETRKRGVSASPNEYIKILLNQSNSWGPPAFRDRLPLN